MKIETPIIIWKRFFIFGSLMVVFLLIIDRILIISRVEEEQTQLVFETLQDHKVLSNELHTVFHSVQDDFKFFEKKILNIVTLNPNSQEYKNDVKSQIDFLETHPGYFKVRLTDSDGMEIYKIVQEPDHAHYSTAYDLHNLSDQTFYKNLNQVHGKEFYFSSMEPNIINGIMEIPLRPTVRVSKRVNIPNKKEKGLLIFNIDGQRILTLFSANDLNRENSVEVALIDHEGFYVASSPLQEIENYTIHKKSLKAQAPKLFQELMSQTNVQGSLTRSNEIVVYSQLNLPNTTERWFLISRVPESFWQKVIYRDRLTWIFWEAFGFVLVMAWLWRDEKKRHKDEVVKVLLRERSEFIQNVSHQLKTPLAIMINQLERKVPTQEDWNEVKKEVQYLIKVVEDMLLLAQVDAYPNITLKQEDILDIVSTAVDMTGSKAKDKGVPIRFNVDEKLLASPQRLERPVMGELLISAIVNLIDNAIDFSPPNETVEVFVAFVDGKLVIQVQDHGPGIPDEFLPKLFERFSRNDRGRKGTGLGLSIAKKIVELHNGEIVLVKHRDGTVFEIRL